MAASQHLTQVGIWEWDVGSPVVAWSDELYRIYGLDPGPGMTFESFLDRVHPDDRAPVLASVDGARQTGGGFQHAERIVLPDGSIRWLETRGMAVRSADGRVTGLIGTCRDVTEERRLQDLREGEQRVLEMLATDAPLGLALEALVRLIESQAPGMVGSVVLLEDGKRLRHGAAPNLPPAFLQAIDGLAIGPGRGSCGSAAYYRRPVVVADIETHPLWDDYRDLALSHGLRACWSVPIFANDGSVLGTFALYYSRPREPTQPELELIDRAIHLAAIAIQRERDQEALRQQEEHLRQSQKMEAIGRLTGAVAHDFNNLLAVIIGYGSLLRRQLAPDHPQRATVDQIIKAGERAVRLTQQLLTFSRKQVLQPTVLDVNAVVNEMEPMLRRLLGETVTVESRLTPEAVSVLADRGQLEQVLMNLCVNARDAMPQGGRLAIETGVTEPLRSEASSGAPVTAERRVTIAVSDTGVGMDAETQRRLFEPFFTTKPPGKGTGLGLSTVYGIVKQSEGSIEAESEVGCGATFRVHLPRVDAAGAGPAHPEETHPANGSETILLVEDEEALRRLGEEVLAGAGYRVLTAPSGASALELALHDSGPIDLVVTDVVLPGMSGPEMVERLLATHPSCRALLVSGYPDEAITDHGILTSSSAFLQKPFSPSALLRAIRVILGTTDAAHGRP